MNLHHLRYFQAVANLQSFTKAAEFLYISQPTLSYAINALEKELGVNLIVRNGRSAALTEEGKVFLAHVDTALKSLEEGIHALNGRADPSLHVVRVLSDRIMVIVSEIKHFKADCDCSGIEFALDRCQSETPERQLLEGDYDIAFQSKEPVSPGLEYVVIPESRLVLLVPLDNPLANNESVDLRDVDWNQKVIYRQTKSPDPRTYQIASIYHQLGYDIRRASSRVETTLGVATLVEAGFGISIVPYLEHLEDFSLKILPITYPPNDSVHYMLRRRENSPLSAADRFFTYMANRHGQFEPIKL